MFLEKFVVALLGKWNQIFFLQCLQQQKILTISLSGERYFSWKVVEQENYVTSCMKNCLVCSFLAIITQFVHTILFVLDWGYLQYHDERILCKYFL